MRWTVALALVVGLLVSVAVVPPVAHADYTATNLPNWAIGPFTRYSGNPVLSPSGSGFEAADLFNPGVVIRNGTWQMLYRAQHVDGGPSEIGYASSTDGYHFTESSSNPVIPNNYSNESAGVEDPRLYILNGTYYSFFTAYNGNTTSINEATSPDGIHWTQTGPVESNTKDAAVVTDPTDVPVEINGKYVMYFGQSSGTGTLIAYSTDFIHWTAGVPVNLNYPGAADPFEICVAVTNYQTMAGGPANPNIDLFVAGTLTGQGQWFYAISELEFSGSDPTVEIHQLSDAVLSPATPYELNGQTPKAVWMNTISFYNGQWWMYYGAGDRFTALATAPLRPTATPPPAGTPFMTSFETGQQLPDWLDAVDTNYPGGGISNVHGICCGLTGPETSMRTENAKHGNTSLLYSGSAGGQSSNYAYTKVFDLTDSPITVDSKLRLYYSIYPLPAGNFNVSGTNSTCVSLDLIFSDGTTLSGLNATDQDGNKIAPASQCGHLKTGQWNDVSALVGGVANGKKIVRIDVGFSDPGGSGGYRGYVDDVALSDDSTSPAFGPPVKITSVSPTTAGAGDIVTVNGVGFGATMPVNGLYLSDNGVNWGQAGNGASFHVDSWSDTQITFTVPTPSGTGNVWTVTPGTTGYFCIATNCSLVGGAVQPPSNSITNTALTIGNSDQISAYYGPHVGIAPDAHLDCSSQLERFDSTSAGAGNFYDADAGAHSLLHPDAGTALTPGGTYTGSGVSFIWPAATCTRDDISTMSTPQTILMPPNNGETSSTTTTLGFLGSGAGGATSGPVTINYTDGTSSTQTLDFGDWCQATPSDQMMVDTVKRTDGTDTCHVFEKTLPVTAGKAVKSIVLPATSALTAGADHMRIFGIGLDLNGKTFPQLAWARPAGITYGAKISATQLDATASGVAGTFSYSANPVGTLLSASAGQTLTATFTPTDTTHFVSGESITTTIAVAQASPVLTWVKPADITYSPLGIGLGAAQLDAKSSVPGTFDYIPQFGTIISAGSSEPLSAKFTPTDTKNYVTGGVVNTTINVKPYSPQLSWDNPNPISFGTKLSVIQLDPISDAVGSFTFNPPAGTILQPGKNQVLHGTFTPLDTVNYVNGNAVSAKLTVTKAPLSIVAGSQKLDYTDVLPDVTADWKAHGFVNGDTVAALTSLPDCAPTTAVTNKQGRIDVKPGVYAIACHGAAAPSYYAITYFAGKLTVLKEDVKLVLSASASYKKNTSAHLKVTLEGDGLSTEPVAGAKVVLGFKGGKTCTATTTSAGVASCSVSVPATAGQASVTASYRGGTYYLSATTSMNVEVTS